MFPEGLYNGVPKPQKASKSDGLDLLEVPPILFLVLINLKKRAGAFIHDMITNLIFALTVLKNF